MIISKDIKSVYKKHRKEILKMVASEHYMRMDVKDLQYVHTSASGAIYYKIPSQMAMPIARLGKNQDLLTWLMQGIDAEDFKVISEKMDKELANAFAGKDWSPTSIGAMTQELVFRAANVRHYDLLLQLIANNLIRSDENPAVINQDILQEKVDDIEAECQLGNTSFFFLLPELKMLKEMQSMSQEELTTYLIGLKGEAERKKKMLEILLSEKGSEKETKTSTSS